MRRIVATFMAGLFLAGCANEQSEPAPKEPQNVLTRMTVAAGYEVAGIPQYEGTRWTSNVRAQDCAANVTVAANEAAEPENPTSFSVASVGGALLAETNPGTAALNLKADSLKSLPGMKDRLDCA